MDATRRIFIRNAESRAEREKRGLLAVSNPLFCPCEIEEAENGFFFCFAAEEDRQDFSAAANLETEEKFRLLANCAALEAARAHYYFALSPDNLVFDRNLCPRILVRDAAAEEDTKEDFFRAYRALAASLLSKRHTYEDFLAGGCSGRKSSSRDSRGRPIRRNSRLIFRRSGRVGGKDAGRKRCKSRGSVFF